jgi:hypothetical protein
MLDGLIRWSLRNRLLVVGPSAILLLAGSTPPPACRWTCSPT